MRFFLVSFSLKLDFAAGKAALHAWSLGLARIAMFRSQPGLELSGVNQSNYLFQIVCHGGKEWVSSHRMDPPQTLARGRSLSKKKAEVNYQNETIVSAVNQ
jgi:hypothetical protein